MILGVGELVVVVEPVRFAIADEARGVVEREVVGPDEVAGEIALAAVRGGGAGDCCRWLSTGEPMELQFAVLH